MQAAVSEQWLLSSALLAALQCQVTQCLCSALTKAALISLTRKKLPSLRAKISLSPELVEAPCSPILRVRLGIIRKPDVQ